MAEEERAVYHWYGRRGRSPRNRRRRRALWFVFVGPLVVAVVYFWLWPVADSGYWEATAPPSCGSTSVRPGSYPTIAGSDAELCFVRAVRACTPRSLLYSESGVDTGVQNDLRVVRSSGACRVVDRVDAYVDLFPRRTGELVCAGARWDGSGWELSCGSSGTLKLEWPRPRTAMPTGAIPDPAG